jgi:hypothetical protein
MIKFNELTQDTLSGTRQVDISVPLKYVNSIGLNLNREKFILKIGLIYTYKNSSMPEDGYYHSFDKLDEILSYLDSNLHEFYKIDELDSSDAVTYIRKSSILGTVVVNTDHGNINKVIINEHGYIEIYTNSKFNELKRRLAIDNL